MTFKLPELPYSKDALGPHISAETLDFHHGKHHAKYVDTINDLIKGTKWADKSLEEIIKGADGGIFNNGAQVWNHTFYWSCMSPKGGGQPRGKLLDALEGKFSSVDDFKKQFTEAAVGRFGSGWAWLVADNDGKLSIEATLNADNPIRAGRRPLLTCDVWEHAYYIDYRNARPKYVESFWNVINWDFVAENLP